MGENEERIKVVGSPEVHELIKNKILYEDLQSRYDIPFSKHNYIVLLYHPITIDFDPQEVKHIVDCCISSKLNFVVIRCNNDTNCDVIFQEYQRLLTIDRFRYLPSMRFEYFVALLRFSSGLVGNSSVGVRETPVLGLPSINIGTRQFNRAKTSESVYHIQDYQQLTSETLIQLSKKKRLERSFEFGGQDSSKKIAQTLNDVINTPVKTQKYFVDF
jgi:UDP-N-acetylglucosamine 2-epimerase (hydrolysing)